MLQHTLLSRRQCLAHMAKLGLSAATFNYSELLMANSLAQSSPGLLVPPYLSQGDTIGISSPAGFVSLEEIQPAIRTLKSWGFSVKVGRSVGQAHGTFGGTDAQRVSDFQALLDDPEIKAILCARGGYGLVRIVDQLNFTDCVHSPKWILGFSDVTVLHSHLNKHSGLASVHCKMATGFIDQPEPANSAAALSIASINDALTGHAIDYPIEPSIHNRDGVGVGLVVGGNLRTLETLSGTASALDTDGKILLLEDVGEALYSVDRMFWHLKRSGKLAKLAGLMIGGFDMPADEENDLPFALDLYQIVLEKVRDYPYPVCFEFPVGHQAMNLAVKMGLPHRLTVVGGRAQFNELV